MIWWMMDTSNHREETTIIYPFYLNGYCKHCRVLDGRGRSDLRIMTSLEKSPLNDSDYTTSLIQLLSALLLVKYIFLNTNQSTPTKH